MGSRRRQSNRWTGGVETAEIAVEIGFCGYWFLVLVSDIEVEGRQGGLCEAGRLRGDVSGPGLVFDFARNEAHREQMSPSDEQEINSYLNPGY